MSKRLPLPKGVVGGERGGRSKGKVGMGEENVKGENCLPFLFRRERAKENLCNRKPCKNTVDGHLRVLPILAVEKR